MKETVCLILASSIAIGAITGCATNGQQPSGTMTGAGIGAVAGGLIGAMTGDWGGAAVGALAGAAIGAVAGHYYDQQTATRAEAEKRYGMQATGDRLEIEGATLKPQDVSGGTAVDSSVQYTALSTQRETQIKLTETRTLVGPKDTIELSKREVTRAQGSHTSTMRFTMPQDIAKGDYTLITTITDGKQTKTVKSPIRVV